MKKHIAIIAGAVATLATAHAQDFAAPYAKGTILANAALGFAPGVGVAISGDYVLLDNVWVGHVTVGGQTFLSGRSYGSYKESFFGIAPRATYGINITNEIEAHAGILLGYQAWTDTYASTGNKYSYGSVLYGGLLGARYAFAENLAALFEVNYAGLAPYINLGVTYKF